MKTKKAVKSVDCEIKSPGVQAGAHTWMQKDLQKSGLSIENFTIEPLKGEAELRERLGFTSISGTPIATVGGYWISYPNVPDYYRLKLRDKIGDAKYLSRKGGGNHPYILKQLEETLSNYTPGKSVFITEGEKKAAKATLEGFPCIGLAGVFNFKDKDNDFLTELEHYVWKNKLVYIVFDSDITHKYEVRRAKLRLSIELSNKGAKVYFGSGGGIRTPDLRVIGANLRLIWICTILSAYAITFLYHYILLNDFRTAWFLFVLISMFIWSQIEFFLSYTPCETRTSFFLFYKILANRNATRAHNIVQRKKGETNG